MSERHGAIGKQQKWRQVRGEVRERQDVGVQVDAERLSHESSAGLNSMPGIGVRGGEFRSERLVGQRHADVFDLAVRISVMLQGKLVGTVNKAEVTKDEVLAMIIIGKLPGEVSREEIREITQ